MLIYNTKIKTGKCCNRCNRYYTGLPILHCIGGDNCIKSTIPLKNLILLQPNFIEIKKLIPKLNKTKLVNCVIKNMKYFVNNPNVKWKLPQHKIFKKCKITKKKMLTQTVDFKERKSIFCHEAIILSWRRGLYEYLNTLYKNDKTTIIKIINNIIPINSKNCLLDFSKYLNNTLYWNKKII
tara:strand:+ start:288 stop:830 length:543 start_codon:yes stop_codon:yes gene_type:complete